METLNNLVEKIKDIFGCVTKRKRNRESSLDENKIFSIKRRRLIESKSNSFSLKEDSSFSANKSDLFYFDDNQFRKSIQTQIIKGRDEDKSFLSNISKKSKKANRKLNFDSNSYDLLGEGNLTDVKTNFINNFSFSYEENNSVNNLNQAIRWGINRYNNKSESEENIKEDDHQNDEPVIKIRYEEINLLSQKESGELNSSEHDSSDDDSDCMNKINDNEEDIQNNEDKLKDADYINEFHFLNEYAESKCDKQNFPEIEYEQFQNFKDIVNLSSGGNQSLGDSHLHLESFTKIAPGNWLNDEVINYYIDLIMRRQEEFKSLNKTHANTFIFNTFFYEKYVTSKKNNEYSYDKMSKFWEKRNINLYSCKYILIPINLTNSHWSLVSANIQERKLCYFDSMDNEIQGYKIMNSFVELFTEYISRNKFREDDLYNCCTGENKIKLTNNLTTIITEDEGTNKLSVSFTSTINNIHETNLNINQGLLNLNESQNNLLDDRYPPGKQKPLVNTNNGDSDSENDLHMIASFWKYKCANVPKQTNGFDCGVFVCKFMDYLARDEPISFTQEDIDYFRVLMGIEIMEGKLLTY